jgi:hypothetical protein
MVLMKLIAFLRNLVVQWAKLEKSNIADKEGLAKKM